MKRSIIKRWFCAANLLTVSRVLLSVCLLFWQVFSVGFYGCYLLAGVSDVLDGAVARATHTTSELGEKLDTLADSIFAGVCFVRILPAIKPPVWVWLWIAVILGVKIINIISGYLMQKKFVAVHSFMNKVTGLLLFLFPLSIGFLEIKYSAAVLIGVALFSAIQEGHLIRTGNQR